MATHNTELLVEFFENSEMLISIYDENLIFLDVNPAFLKALHLKREQVIGKDIREISPTCESSGRYAIYKEVIRTGKTFISDQVQLHPRLGSLHLRLRAFRVGKGMAISSKDVTDLRETISDLETFIYKTSHDVRAPIATTLGVLAVAKDEFKESEIAMQYCDMIKNQTDKLDNIVNTLTSTIKLRQLPTTIDEFDIGSVIEDATQSLAHLNSSGQLEIIREVNIHHPVRSDKYLVYSILRNLIHNAMLFQQENHKHPFVRVLVSEQNHGISITVEDNGTGIAPELQPDIFKMFSRGNSSVSGNGLGLYSVKQAVKKLGGHIHFNSEVKKGSKFVAWIPNTPPADEELLGTGND